jgi:CBS domain-containing protein
MEVLDTVRAVLAQKGSKVWSVTPDATVYDAIALMAEHNIGSVLVMDSDRLVGLLSERDYTRKIILMGKQSKSTPVREIMSTDITAVSPLATVEHCMRLMTDKRVRHLPVVDDEQHVVGVVSIGNLVNWIISAQSSALESMEKLIGAEYPG